ncbi:L-seryl-tRNA(Sec) selenium transferase [Teichococcus vastitatis]|uniref:L-seryl-tRNA(Sec) selenium transferase n=1 Tax=Teichococcus vastitatis TaxID=2307076 RepID=A0ABS9WC19_9PROT|nr:L-seryl-tRNA(Sec) selenium transferase [Pseudoroseomonas vastitatis]MCI0756763.1 L-seryl-tRNA(Sec) selenium transferase [Pseudoroseomonas vastitatis]
MADKAALRALPSVDRVLAAPGAASMLQRFGRAEATAAIRAVLAEIRAGGATPVVPDAGGVAARAAAALEARDRSGLRPLFNLTGTVLHTNLGRAVLADAAIEAAMAAMRDAVALEFDLASGRRGERDDHLRALLRELTGAEDATVVNNNAAAVLIALNTLGEGRQAVVSRGELIEIGGAFRMPDIMARAGVRLVEVGTTNRTHARDYRAALGPDTALLMKVHTSNYRIEGFTAEVGGAELAAVARDAGVPLLNDLGSGTLIDLSRHGLQREPTVREAVEDGADLVTFSGDKLLGGPQAGFIVGRAELIGAINRNPMKRALRVDKIRLAALEATLKLYRDPDRLADRLPALGLLARRAPEIEAQARRLLEAVEQVLPADIAVEAVPCRSQIGSGALPLDTLPSFALRFTAPRGRDLEAFVAALRELPRPVIGRLREGALLLDLRCLTDEAAFLDNLAALAAPHGPV